MSKKINIIGAGIAGLSAGCYLQMNGYETEIFELNSVPGGLCTSWHRGEYTFDGCLHWLVGSNPSDNFYPLWNELIDMKKLKFIDFEYHSCYQDSKGNSLKFYCDAEKFRNELLQIAPEDKITINNFFKSVKKFSKFNLPVDKAYETYNFADSIKMLIKIIPFVNSYKKWINFSLSDFANSFKNELVRNALRHQPSEDLPALFFLMMTAWMNRKSAGYPIGGSLNFSKLIEKKYFELGGKINYKSKVTKIIVKDKSAKGIQLENGDTYFSDTVISAADGYYTIFKMLDGNFTDKKIEKAYNTFKTFPSYFQVSLGVNRKFDNIPHSIKFPIDKKIKIDTKTEYDYINVRIFSFDKTMSPEGKTSLYAFFVSEDHTYWENLRKNDKLKYQSEKERIANEVIEILDNKFGNIKSTLEEVDVSTPATVIRYTNNWKGSYEGWLPNKESGVQALKKTLPGLENFYMIGQWVEVGGGVPPALLSGRNVTQIICKKDKKKFITTHY